MKKKPTIEQVHQAVLRRQAWRTSEFISRVVSMVKEGELQGKRLSIATRHPDDLRSRLLAVLPDEIDIEETIGGLVIRCL